MARIGRRIKPFWEQSNDEARLDSFDKAEWRSIARMLKPEWTEAEFEAAWAEFVEMKRKHALH